uniref:Vanin-like protein 1 n=2 Tax=Culex pipiens TaxID=7175 RepID=A0A8D8G9W1_CULPI
MKITFAVLFLCHYIVVSQQVSTPEDDYYWAGVVEFSFVEKWSGNVSAEENTANNLDKYLEIIRSVEAQPVDIIVFPEYTLNSIESSSRLPDPEKGIAPCDDLQYAPIVRDLSCVANATQKYLVVNMVEMVPCDNLRTCLREDSSEFFNTNVVFDRSGVVIARYRKFNLYGEAGISVTPAAEMVTFDTDFGVTFGTIICHDLIFDLPALGLIRHGITDIIFPTMWFSQLPFLTAAQIQQGWAYKNNVNFLAAGASNPGVSSTGTGIFAGKRGRIVTVMNHQDDVKLYVAAVPKVNRPQAVIKRQPVVKDPVGMKDLMLKRDQIDHYAASDLPLRNNPYYSATVCQNELCCDFTLNYTYYYPSTTQDFYRYKLLVNDGHDSKGRIACAIVACTNETLETCGSRFEDPSSVVPAIQFNFIDISGRFPGGENVFMVPNGVDTSVLPLEVEEFEYSEHLYVQDGNQTLQIRQQLMLPRSDLLTFGIWGRKFDNEDYRDSSDDGATSTTVSILTMLFALIATVLTK